MQPLEAWVADYLLKQTWATVTAEDMTKKYYYSWVEECAC